MTIIEIIAAVFGFLCVWFCIIRNVWTWPTGLLQVLLLIAVFYHAKLYADMALHVIYVGLQIFGWVAWQKSKRISQSSNAGSEIVYVRSLTLQGNIACMLVTVFLTIAFSSMLTFWTDAELPIADSFVAAAENLRPFTSGYPAEVICEGFRPSTPCQTPAIPAIHRR